MVLERLRDRLEAVLSSGSGDLRRPELRRGNESSVRGLYVIGDLAGAPVIKLAMAQGVEVIQHLAGLPEMRERARGDLLDVLIVGAGAAGLNAALAAKERGWSLVVLEKGKIANTIENRAATIAIRPAVSSDQQVSHEGTHNADSAKSE